MMNFLVNEPQHKKWALPNSRYHYNTVLYGDVEFISVVDTQTSKSVLHHYLKLSDPNWQSLSHQAQEFASRKFDVV